MGEVINLRRARKDRDKRVRGCWRRARTRANFARVS